MRVGEGTQSLSAEKSHERKTFSGKFSLEAVLTSEVGLSTSLILHPSVAAKRRCSASDICRVVWKEVLFLKFQ